jgi:hypothetical protein
MPVLAHIPLARSLGGHQCYESFATKHTKPSGEICKRYACRTCLNKRLSAAHAKYYKENAEWRKAASTKWNLEHPREVMLYGARRRAKRFNVPFTITVEDIEIPDRCPVFGFTFIGPPKTIGSDTAVMRSPSLDRIVPRLGYVPGNVQVISLKANLLKSSRPIAQWVAISRWMLDLAERYPEEEQL